MQEARQKNQVMFFSEFHSIMVTFKLDFLIRSYIGWMIGKANYVEYN